ncbi:hypothetical protein XENOCAPTIV_028867 [Xenoophorus captivus]|uniref:Uncharacterized protein n=1 Tax=Xenoophorus captivus TaxID=1517983 RepID=A0ABV0R288_9TELE
MRAGVTAQQTDNNDVLKAISSLHAELARLKLDICNKIEAEISEKVLSIRDLTYGAQRIWIFRDLPPEVTRR